MQKFPVTYSSLVPKALLSLVIDKYNLPKSSEIVFLKKGFNDTYLIESNGSKFIFRVYSINRRSYESINEELNFLNYLNENGVSVSVAIKDNEGNFIQPINAPEGIRYAALFTFAEGEMIRKLSNEQCYSLGKELAKIHVLSQDRTLSYPTETYDYKELFEKSLNLLNPLLVNFKEEYLLLVNLFEEYKMVFDKIDKTKLSIGICYGDLQSENFRIKDEQLITFFDFDFFGNGCLAYDIGVFIWYDHKSKPKEIIQEFLNGYQCMRRLTDEEKKFLPYFAALRAVFQMTLFAQLNNGQLLPLWHPLEIARFVKKITDWLNTQKSLSYN